MKITKEELKELYDTKSISEICVHLSISQPTLYKLLRKANIKTRRPRHHVEVIGSYED